MLHLRRFALLAAVTFAAITGLPASPVVAQDVFYAASGSNGVAGSLFTLNSTTGAATLVGALTDGTNLYGMTGLAFQPGSGTLFGATANGSPTAGASLVTINRFTGAVSVVGAFNVSSAMSDITFAPNGTLYGWGAASHSLYTINPVTGAATIVAVANPNPGFGGGSLASNLAGVIFSTPNSSSNPPGNLDTVNTVTGQLTFIANLSGGPVGNNVINSSDFSTSGILFGINSNQSGSPTLTHLVTINTSTGAITDVGNTFAGDIDGFAILRTVGVPEPTTWALMGLSGVIVSGGYYWRRRRAQGRVRGWNPSN